MKLSISIVTDKMLRNYVICDMCSMAILYRQVWLYFRTKLSLRSSLNQPGPAATKVQLLGAAGNQHLGNHGRGGSATGAVCHPLLYSNKWSR